MEMGDPVDALSDMVDDFASYINGSEVEHRESIRYRLNLLWVHAFAALIIAPTFALSSLNGASFFALRQLLPYTNITAAVILGVGGLILGVGCVFRLKRLEIVGLAFLAFWYGLIAVSFAASILWYWSQDIRPQVPPTYYAPFLYSHLTTIMAVHMGTLIRRLRADKGHPWTSHSHLMDS